VLDKAAYMPRKKLKTMASKAESGSRFGSLKNCTQTQIPNGNYVKRDASVVTNASVPDRDGAAFEDNWKSSFALTNPLDLSSCPNAGLLSVLTLVVF